jgi:hypothetical protein
MFVTDEFAALLANPSPFRPDETGGTALAEA